MLADRHQGACAPCPAPFNLAAHVMGQADAQPDKIALAILGLSGTERWSYARLQSAILGTGTGLLQAGLVPGDRVLMRLGNTVEFPVAYLGAIAVGLVPIPTSSQLTAPEVAGIIDTTAPRLILRAGDIACPETDLPILDAPALQAMHDLPAADWHMGDPERMAYIIYTSGTSGTPRAVCHAHRAIWARRMMFDGWYGLAGDHPCDIVGINNLADHPREILRHFSEKWLYAAKRLKQGDDYGGFHIELITDRPMVGQLIEDRALRLQRWVDEPALW
jgi:acyl-CoA synthetase (AMP-forming)/AMP-acid ligase II